MDDIIEYEWLNTKMVISADVSGVQELKPYFGFLCGIWMLILATFMSRTVNSPSQIHL